MMTIVECPTCGSKVEWSEKAKWRPFCSERCKLIDLGAWADEQYSIASSPTTPMEYAEEPAANKYDD